MKIFKYRTIINFVFLFSLQVVLPAQTYNPQLKPYVNFLNTQHQSAKEYVLNLFNKYDIVILCERDHRDTTQYDLYLSIIKDKRFIEEVGNVFTEIGVSTLRPAINTFLHTEGLTEDSVSRAILAFHRNASYYPLWEQENFSYFLRGLYSINKSLLMSHKINYYPSDVPFNWKNMDTTNYRNFVNTVEETARDSIMASQIIHNIDSLNISKSTHKKALVIMNYRHAFGNKYLLSGKKPNNVGRFLFDKYSNRVANVYVNWLAMASGPSNDVILKPIQGGRWDAAFKLLNKEDLGFNLINTPFGNDNFDIWFFKNPFKFADVFTGFIFWLPIEKFSCVIGIPGIIDSPFSIELLRRYDIYNAVHKRKQNITVEWMKKYYNIRRVIPYEQIDSIIAKRNKWLHE